LEKRNQLAVPYSNLESHAATLERRCIVSLGALF